MSWESLAFVLAIHAVALISPGPDFAIVTRLSIVSGRQTGLWAASGVATAIGVYVLICALGLSLILGALPGLSSLLSVMGAIYLAWLGIQCLRSSGQLADVKSPAPGSKAFLTGFFTNLLNPKAMLYFGSVLSQVLTPDLGALETAFLGVLLVGESFLWFGMVSFLFSSRRILDWLQSRLVWFERFIGVLLLGLAAKLAVAASR